MAVENGAFSDEAFAKMAEKFTLFCHITSQVPEDKHQDLLEQKGGQGFPHIVFMDAEGNVLATHEGPRTVAGFESTGRMVAGWAEARTKAAAGDAAAKVDVVLYEIELGKTKLEEGREKLKGLGELTEAQKGRLDALETKVKVEEIVQSAHDQASAEAAGQKLHELKKAGKKLPEGDPMLRAWWGLLKMHAEKSEDADLYEEALTALKKLVFEEHEATLKRLREKKDRKQ
jgi:hypothetical protein